MHLYRPTNVFNKITKNSFKCGMIAFYWIIIKKHFQLNRNQMQTFQDLFPQFNCFYCIISMFCCCILFFVMFNICFYCPYSLFILFDIGIISIEMYFYGIIHFLYSNNITFCLATKTSLIVLLYFLMIYI